MQSPMPPSRFQNHPMPPQGGAFVQPPFPPPPPEALPEAPKNNWATLNFIFYLCGYTLCGALLSPLSGLLGLSIVDSWLINYPVRGFQMVVAAYCLFVVGKDQRGKMQWTGLHTLLIVLWVMGLLRVFIDVKFFARTMSFPTAWNIDTIRTPVKYWGYFVLGALSMFSVLRTIHLIDFKKAIKWLFWASLVGSICSLWTMNRSISIASDLGNREYSGSRATAGVSLHTQALGGFGMTTAIISFYYLMEIVKGFNWKKVFAILGIFIGLYLSIKAGSRGPFLGLIVFLGFYTLVKFTKYAIVALPLVGILGAVGYAIRFKIVSLIGIFNPIIEKRLLLTLEEGDTSYRTELWEEYWNLALEHPVMGVHSTTFGYSHNEIIDQFFQYGFILGWLGLIPILVAPVLCYKLLKSGNENWWVAIFVIYRLSQVVTQSDGVGLLTLIVILYLLKKGMPKDSGFIDGNNVLQSVPPCQRP
ncbi:MAG: O-antigen ligase family protein [Opitutales bacterium]|nr:O-antigen ligase family protein [Opitutales bacterium]